MIKLLVHAQMELHLLNFSHRVSLTAPSNYDIGLIIYSFCLVWIKMLKFRWRNNSKYVPIGFDIGWNLRVIETVLLIREKEKVWYKNPVLSCWFHYHNKSTLRTFVFTWLSKGNCSWPCVTQCVMKIILVHCLIGLLNDAFLCNCC